MLMKYEDFGRVRQIVKKIEQLDSFFAMQKNNVLRYRSDEAFSDKETDVLAMQKEIIAVLHKYHAQTTESYKTLLESIWLPLTFNTMPLINSTSERQYQYITIFGHRLCLRQQEDFEGATPRTNKNGNTVYERYFSRLEGLLFDVVWFHCCFLGVV